VLDKTLVAGCAFAGELGEGRRKDEGDGEESEGDFGDGRHCGGRGLALKGLEVFVGLVLLELYKRLLFDLVSLRVRWRACY